jgi:glycosyltransferase involved in cell wall biosynthesis
MNIESLLTSIAWFIAGFTLLQWTIAALNYFFRVNYNRYASVDKPLVTVIIPARNEEATIGFLLDDLQKQDYPRLQIIVANDDSTDNTPEIVAIKQKDNPSIQLLNTGLKDNEWLGKNHACYFGSRQAKGKYLLFLDADVRIGTNAITSTIGYLQNNQLVFLSVFPKQLIPSIDVYRVVPLMNYILLSLLPLFMVKNSPFPSMAAANGQFMLFDHNLYRALEPHKHYKKEKVEDIHIARYIKRSGYKTACLTGNDDISCRMYDTYNAAIEGFSKNVFAFFGGSVTAGLMFWLVNLTGFFWMLLLPIYMPVLYLFFIITMRWFIASTSRQHSFLNIVMHYSQLWSLGKLMLRSIHHQQKKSYQWKGRYIN